MVLWNKADAATDPAAGGYVSAAKLAAEAARRHRTVAVSAKTGEGMGRFYEVLGGLGLKVFWAGNVANGEGVTRSDMVPAT